MLRSPPCRKGRDKDGAPGTKVVYAELVGE
jgi:hypothetical protein